MAKKQVVDQEPEESSEAKTVFVSVKRKVVGMPDEFDDQVIEVPAALAEEQLSLPTNERNSHWRTAKLVEGPKSKAAVAKAVESNPANNTASED